jgi:hypothetical protein
MTYRLGLGVSMKILRDPRVVFACNNRQPTSPSTPHGKGIILLHLFCVESLL